ncbi:flagellar basal body-associated protein FliL [Pseudomaricurvus alkylphenolicus]|uniref:flagellar basal body-associated FliL family protein n=1 Tax=Pseudomaricurvus alkylphenolicus TaxID=1306991 RepID=UPI001421986A|nr:flagellar basal body-associated FliL family protein [Pseudomaricurvus alkylphenolicus]NIB43200.1 flagellar basal body-associated protein FliL [Pseudomaricurvus alkylphenolicus]
MAEDANEQTGNSGGGKKKLIMMIVIGLVLIGLSVGGTLLALKFVGGDEPAATAEAEPDAPVEEVKKPAIYYPLKPTIIVNFSARGRQRFLQAEVSLMVREEDVVAAIEEHGTMLQHGLLMLFSGQDYGELQTDEGKELLRQMALEEVQRMLEQEIGKPGVEQVLFTNFVMQ